MPDYQLYWGEIHNHNELGYAQGSLERSYAIARSHLDFYAFTPHGMHADGGVRAYPVVERNWSKIQQAAAVNNTPGEFTCFLAYEWHSNAWGHVHVVYGEDDKDLHFEPTLGDLQQHFRGEKVMLLPHHTAYISGVDWELFDAALSPVVEIFSEHGCSERDIGLHPMLGHSGGPGDAHFTAQHGLALGKRFGFTAGTDNHDGYPGGYGLGLTGVLAAENSRPAIFDAICQRRTLAVTGDRIGVDFRAGEAPMGSVMAAADLEELSFAVQGWDFIKLVELVRDNVPVQVWTSDYNATAAPGEDIYRLRIEWGWGPMKGFQLFDWQGQIDIDGGVLEEVMPCFSSDPFDEHRRKRIVEQDSRSCSWQSHTSRGGALTSRNGNISCRANDALCLQVRGNKETRLTLNMDCQTHTSLVATGPDWLISPNLGKVQSECTIGELLAGRKGLRVEEVPTSVVLHRAIPQAQYTVKGTYAEDLQEPACYYLRVTQENGQMAWASPIWVEV